MVSKCVDFPACGCSSETSQRVAGNPGRLRRDLSVEYDTPTVSSLCTYEKLGATVTASGVRDNRKMNATAPKLMTDRGNASAGVAVSK